MATKGKKCACYTISILILSLLISVAVVKFVAGPNIAKKKFLTYISSFWAGNASVEEVKFNLFGPLYFNRVSFLGPDGRQWAYAESFEVTLENWPSLKMKLENIKIDSLKLQLYPDQQGWSTLFKIVSKETKGVKEKSYLPSSTVEDISVYLVDQEKAELFIDGFSLSSQQKEDLYEVSLATRHPDQNQNLNASGTINLDTMQTRMSVQMSHQVKMGEISPIVRLLSGSKDYSGEGQVTANAKMSGSLKDLNSLQPEGTIELTDCSLSYKEFESVATSINCNILLSRNNISCKNLSAVVYEGTVDGNFNIDYGRSDPIASSGEFKIKELQLAELAKDFESMGKAGKGTAEAEFVFSGASWNLQDADGHGYIELRDSDLFGQPITSRIFKLVGLKDQQLTAMTDAVCTFTKTGSIVTIREAKARSKYGAIVVEPGGIVDQRKNSIDIYVIAVPVRALRGLLEKIPFASIVTSPTDKLTRIRVEGNLSDPPNKLIKKQPFRDVAAGTMSFIKEVVKSGGDMSKTAAGSTHGLFESLAGRNDKE